MAPTGTVTGTAITVSPKRGTVPRTSPTPLARRLPRTSRLTDTPSKSTGVSPGFCSRSLTRKRPSIPCPASGSTPTTSTVSGSRPPSEAQAASGRAPRSAARRDRRMVVGGRPPSAWGAGLRGCCASGGSRCPVLGHAEPWRASSICCARRGMGARYVCLTRLCEGAGQCGQPRREVCDGRRCIVKTGAPWRWKPHGRETSGCRPGTERDAGGGQAARDDRRFPPAATAPSRREHLCLDHPLAPLGATLADLHIAALVCIMLREAADDADVHSGVHYRVAEGKSSTMTARTAGSRRGCNRAAPAAATKIVLYPSRQSGYVPVNVWSMLLRSSSRRRPQGDGDLRRCARARGGDDRAVPPAATGRACARPPVLDRARARVRARPLDHRAQRQAAAAA